MNKKHKGKYKGRFARLRQHIENIRNYHWAKGVCWLCDEEYERTSYYKVRSICPKCLKALGGKVPSSDDD